MSDTLNVILKYEGDVKKAQGELSKLIDKKSAEARAKESQPAPAASGRRCQEGDPALSMQSKIVEFTNLLRKSGVRVSVAEDIDAFLASTTLSIEDREIFKDALRAVMIKRGDDIGTFDQLFDLFWSGFYDGLRESFGDLEQPDGRDGHRPRRPHAPDRRDARQGMDGATSSSRSSPRRCSPRTSRCSRT